MAQQQQQRFDSEDEVKILTITDPKQAKILSAAASAPQCMLYYTRRDEKGQIISIDITLDCEGDKATQALLEALMGQ